MHSAMVLTGESMGSLAITRSLGRKDIAVYVGSSRKPSKTHFSRYCSKSFYYPHQTTSGLEEMHDQILKNVKKFEPRVLFSMGVVSSYILFKHAKEYEKYTTLVPNVGFRKFRYFNDKEMQLKGAKKVGFRIPTTYVAHSQAQAKEIAAKIKYPALIKPRVSAGGIGIIKVNNPNQLIEQHGQTTHRKKLFCFDCTNPLIQEFIQGDIYGIYGIFDKGNEIASIVFKTYRYHSEFGFPMVQETVCDEKIRGLVVGMLRKLKWHGPFSIQCVLDKSDNILKLLDFNPRMFTHMQSVIAAGIDLPYLAYQMAIGKKVEKIEEYPCNQKFRYMLYGEISYFLHSNHKMRLAREYLDFKNTKTNIDLHDPMPDIVHLYDFIRHGQTW